MWNKLKARWNVNDWQLICVLCTFALGGSSCGYMARWTMGFLVIENQFLRTPIYFLLLTAFWPLCVILISIPFGQFLFFKNYLRKVFSRFSAKRKQHG